MKYCYKTVFLTFLLAVFLLAGCAPKATPKVKVYWPPPPNDSKMEWIVTYATEDDFRKTESEKMRDKVIGTAAANRFGKPIFAASRGDGVVYVSDIDNAEIRVLDFNERTSTVLEASISMPLGLAFDSEGSFFVADARQKQIFKFNSQMEPVQNFGSGSLLKPTYIALDESRSRLYVSDVQAHQVVAFDLASGEELFVIDGKDGEAEKLYGPQGVAVDAQGRVFVAEQLNARIQVFDTEGKFLYMFGVRSDQESDFEGPRGLAFDSENNLFVADVRKGRLMIFTPEGEPLTTIGSNQYYHPLSFRMPSGVYIDPNDRIYIADGLTRRITIWQMLTPAYLAEHPIDQAYMDKIEQDVLLRIKEKEEGKAN